MKIETLSLKTTLKGARVWLNNKDSVACGFVEGTTYKTEHCGDHVVVTVDALGTRTVAKGNIVDLQNRTMSKTFKDVDRVHVSYCEGKMVIRAYHYEEKVKRRETSLKERIMRKIPLRLGDFFFGTGLLSKKITQGLLAAGISTSLVFANDVDRHAADIFASCNHPSYIKANGPVIVQDDLFTMDKSLICEMDLMIIGHPCVAFSKQQSKTRKKDIHHPLVGTLFVPLLESINRANPSFIIIENSDWMLGSDTDYIISDVLDKTGYAYSHQIVSGRDFGAFESRERLAKVFYSKGLGELNLTELTASIQNTRKVSDVLESISPDDNSWKPYDYLKKKNHEDHHCHSFLVAQNDDTKLPTFGANYGRRQPDSAFLEHPTNPDLHRIFSAGEHCNVRGISGDLKREIVSIEDGTHHLQNGRTNIMKAHHLLGNSIAPEPWFYVGNFIGDWLTSQFPIYNPHIEVQQELFA